MSEYQVVFSTKGTWHTITLPTLEIATAEFLQRKNEQLDLYTPGKYDSSDTLEDGKHLGTIRMFSVINVKKNGCPGNKRGQVFLRIAFKG